MKKHFLILVIFFFLGEKSLFSQEKSIKLQSNDSIENVVLKKIDITKNDSKNSILKKLREEGYFYSNIDSINKQLDKVTLFHVTLGQKIDSLILRIPTKFNYLRKDLPILENPTLKTKFTNFNSIITEIQNHFSKQGKPFTNIRLQNISLDKDLIYADLDI